MTPWPAGGLTCLVKLFCMRTFNLPLTLFQIFKLNLSHLPLISLALTPKGRFGRRGVVVRSVALCSSYSDG